MICPSCGKKHPANTRTCPVTGAPITNISGQKHSGVILCHDCGSPFPTGAKYCPVCGAYPPPEVHGATLEEGEIKPIFVPRLEIPPLEEPFFDIPAAGPGDAPTAPQETLLEELPPVEDYQPIFPQPEEFVAQEITGDEEISPPEQIPLPEEYSVIPAARPRLSLKSLLRWEVFAVIALVLLVLLFVNQIRLGNRIDQLETRLADSQVAVQTYQKMVTDLMVQVELLKR